MNVLSGILKHFTKLFGISAFSSVIFAGLWHKIAHSKPLVYIAMLLASLVLFLFLYDRLCYSLYTSTYTIKEYISVAVVSLTIYILFASVLYYFRLSDVYIWLFLPTRFLEPFFRHGEKISFFVCYLMMFIVLIRIPVK